MASEETCLSCSAFSYEVLTGSSDLVGDVVVVDIDNRIDGGSILDSDAVAFDGGPVEAPVGKWIEFCRNRGEVCQFFFYFSRRGVRRVSAGGKDVSAGVALTDP